MAPFAESECNKEESAPSSSCLNYFALLLSLLRRFFPVLFVLLPQLREKCEDRNREIIGGVQMNQCRPFYKRLSGSAVIIVFRLYIMNH